MTAAEVREAVAPWPVTAPPRRLAPALVTIRAPLVVSGLVLLSAVAPLAPLRDGQTGIADGRLRLSPAYVALAPLCDMMDAISMLSMCQHIAFMATVVAVCAVWRACARPRSPATRRPGVFREGCGVLHVLCIIVATYALVTLVERPMSALELTRADELAIDFHSHTEASWDGRRGFTAERNLAWHRDAGFDVAYVSEHLSTGGPTAALPPNGRLSGAGTLLLPAIEIGCEGIHVVLIGITQLGARHWCVDRNANEGEAEPSLSARGDSVVSIATIPGQLEEIARADVDAVELADAAPRAFDQLARDRGALEAIACRRNLALVAGSNLHGWGRTATAWSVMEIPGWRTMTPADLDAAIRRRLREEGNQAVRVIERPRVRAGSSLVSLASTAPAVTWNLLATLSAAERWSWIAWAWALWLAVRTARWVARQRVV